MCMGNPDVRAAPACCRGENALPIINRPTPDCYFARREMTTTSYWTASDATQLHYCYDDFIDTLAFLKKYFPGELK
jgi:hypothetical protein